MNKVILTGNLTRDPELKIYNGTVVAKCAIAVARPVAKGKDAETDFFNVTAFGATAEFFSKWFSKGSRVIIEGRLQNNNYTDKDGNKHNSTDVIITQLEFGDSKKKAATSADGKPDEIDAADLPF